MKRYRLSRPAKVDLDRIWDYVARNGSVERADRLIDRITNRFSILARAPQVGVDRNEVEAGLRSFPVGVYLIYYREADSGGVLIARVLHGMRDQEKAYRS